jgi:hypothetical protein
MDFNKYPEYASIAQHIRSARIERGVMIAHSIAGFVVDVWNAIKAPPAPPALLPIDRRRESRTGVQRLAHR